VVEIDQGRGEPEGHEEGHGQGQTDEDGQQHPGDGHAQAAGAACRSAAHQGAAADDHAHGQNAEPAQHVEEAQQNEIGGFPGEAGEEVGQFRLVVAFFLPAYRLQGAGYQQGHRGSQEKVPAETQPFDAGPGGHDPAIAVEGRGSHGKGGG